MRQRCSSVLAPNPLYHWIKLISSLASGDIIMTVSSQDKIHYKISFLMHIRKTNKTRLICVIVVLLFFCLFCFSLQNSVLGNLVVKDIDLQVQWSSQHR